MSNKLKRLIVDTGTTFFTAPDFLYDDVLRRLPSAPCAEVDSNPQKYPPLTFVLRDARGQPYNLEVPQETYMLGDGDSSANARNDEGQCKPAFMRLYVARGYGPAMILGEVFMRSFFTVFSRGGGDEGSAKVGFARAKQGAVPKDVGEPSLLQPSDVAAAADALEEERVSASAPKTPLARRAQRRRQRVALPTPAASYRLVRREEPEEDGSGGDEGGE
mmetsp:Transcript_117724/g.329667  ORF Transcript_117724/g.329667 Transcript_117724/m.329667 type:complete len:218 (-) Transcript_117724:80-733(-)